MQSAGDTPDDTRDDLRDDLPTAPEWRDAALSANLRLLRARIAAAATRSGRPANAIELVAVSKTVPAERLLAAAALGLTTFGENRVQEAREKREWLAQLAETDPTAARLLAGMRWELIGHLQSNKVARAFDLFARVQSVDSIHLAETLSARAVALGRTLPILLEVNIGAEASKSGFAPDAETLLAAARAIATAPNLRPDGLMCVAPIAERADEARPFFQRLRGLRDLLRAQAPLGEGGASGGWDDLSMGMTDDFEVAIEEGATSIRIGRGLFGARRIPSPDPPSP